MIFKSPKGTLRGMVVTQKCRNFWQENSQCYFAFFMQFQIIIVQEPNILRPRGFRLCEPFGPYHVKMKES